MKRDIIFCISRDRTDICKIIKGNRIPEGFSELRAEMTEGAGEKHLPVVSLEGNTVVVKVGSVFHPMLEEHSIEWVYLESEQGEQIIYLTPGKEPAAKFALLPDDRPVCVYAYCNLHGLWKLPLEGQHA